MEGHGDVDYHLLLGKKFIKLLSLNEKIYESDDLLGNFYFSL